MEKYIVIKKATPERNKAAKRAVVRGTILLFGFIFLTFFFGIHAIFYLIE